MSLVNYVYPTGRSCRRAALNPPHTALRTYENTVSKGNVNNDSGLLCVHSHSFTYAPCCRVIGANCEYRPTIV